MSINIGGGEQKIQGRILVIELVAQAIQLIQ